MRKLYFQCPDAHRVSKSRAIQIQHTPQARKLADSHEWLKFREVLFSAVSGMGSLAKSHSCHVAFSNNSIQAFEHAALWYTLHFTETPSYTHWLILSHLLLPMHVSRKRSNVLALMYIDEKAEKHSSGCICCCWL